MDWDLKTPSWDLTELEPELMPNMAPLVGFNNLGGQKSKGECSVDLKLGRLEDFGDGSQDKLKDPRVSMNVSSSSGSSKTARVPNGTQIVSCLVDGCKSDLSQCKDYHRRHKVCEVHSKAPTVMVGGQAQRFCQQCSRFHLLAEFDEAKRSCRKRLDGHNRRRRKPQPESPSMNSRSSFSNHQGSKLLPFSSPQIFPTSVVSPTWAGVVKTEEDATIYNCYQQLVDNPQNPFFGSFSFNYKGGGEQFPFSHSNNSTLISQTAPGASVGQALLNTISSSGGEGSRKMFSNGLTKVLDSDCALSLLSTPLTQTPGISLNHMVEAEPIPMALPLVPSLQYSDQGQYACSRGMEDEQVGSVLLTNASDADRHCQGIFHVGSDGSSRNGGLQMLPSLGSSYDSCGCPRL